MGAVKNHFHDEIERRAAVEAGEEICTLCSEELADVGGICRFCLDTQCSQLGVGA